MVNVHENCNFTETTINNSTIEELSFRNCSLKVIEKLEDFKWHVKKLKFKNTILKIGGKDDTSLKTLKKMLISTMYNLELLSLEPLSQPSLEEYLDFFSSGFTHL